MLRRLDATATTEIVARVVGSPTDQIARSAIESIQNESEGVPFFVEELAHLREEGLLRPEPTGQWNLAEGAASLVPQSVRGVIGRRLARLNPAARDILAVASVYGREFGSRIVADVAGRRGIADGSDVDDAFDEAVGRRLLIERGSTYVFVHEQIREVLYQGLSAVRRRQLHQLTADAIEREGGDVSRLAYHYIRGDDLQRRCTSVVAAEEAARVRAIDDATRHYDNALEILELIGDSDLDQRRFDILQGRDAVRSSPVLNPAGVLDRRHAGAQQPAVRSAQVTAHVRASFYSLDSGHQTDAVSHARTAVELSDSDQAPTVSPPFLPSVRRWRGGRWGAVSALPVSRSAARRRRVFQSSFEVAGELDCAWEQARIAQELGVLLWAPGTSRTTKPRRSTWMAAARFGRLPCYQRPQG